MESEGLWLSIEWSAVRHSKYKISNFLPIRLQEITTQKHDTMTHLVLQLDQVDYNFTKHMGMLSVTAGPALERKGSSKCHLCKYTPYSFTCATFWAVFPFFALWPLILPPRICPCSVCSPQFGKKVSTFVILWKQGAQNSFANITVLPKGTEIYTPPD